MATPVKRSKAFSVSQVAVPKKAVHPAAHLAKAYAKHHKAVPANIQKAADGSTGSVAADPTSNDEEYLCQVQVGQDTLNLDFDTGSADLWVFSDQLDSSTTSGHGVYQTGNAQQEQGESWSISYGDGSGASGTVYSDTVVIGGVTATSQAVEAATSISSQFASGQGDGLVGLAFSSINTVTPDRANTFFDTVSSQLAADLFTARLKKGTPGTYDFGYIDNAKYSGEIYYTNVDNSQGFWGFTPDSYSVGSSQGSATIGSAIADTGTTLLLLPDDVVSDYYSKVDGAQNDSSQGGYIFSCSASLPDFSISVGGGTITVPGDYINFQSVDGSNCFGGLQSSGSIGQSIFGDVFLKAAFVVFDGNNGSPRLGFATGA
ncbi:aspartyl protease [Myriangium duriaei CBS 260.36]|uniref:Aspartyl protease n=1 Tax=Myriangium duriaei CBS 260.36 TaxID=1168546 RepID=A0A9P4MF84_9PEZI|nr:aspartyl protease [Myriangium duriaei CBS 260.36]